MEPFYWRSLNKYIQNDILHLDYQSQLRFYIVPLKYYVRKVQKEIHTDIKITDIFLR